MHKTTPPVRWIEDFPLLRILLAICLKSREPNFLKVMDSSFSSICKFSSFKNPFETINILSELYFRLRRFILLAQTKKVISMNYCSNTSCWKPWWWVRFDLILMMRDIYISFNLNPLTELTSSSSSSSSSRSTEFKHILPWNISQIIMTTIPRGHKNSHKPCHEMGHPVLTLLKRQWKLKK